MRVTTMPAITKDTPKAVVDFAIMLLKRTLHTKQEHRALWRWNCGQWGKVDGSTMERFRLGDDLRKTTMLEF